MYVFLHSHSMSTVDEVSSKVSCPEKKTAQQESNPCLPCEKKLAYHCGIGADNVLSSTPIYSKMHSTRSATECALSYNT